MNSLQYFRMFAPEFAAVLDADVNAWIAISVATISAACLDAERLAMLHAYNAAHLISLSKRSGGAVGAVTSESEGDLSRSYAGSGNAGDFGQTQYGMQAAQLIQACVGATIMTR